MKKLRKPKKKEILIGDTLVEYATDDEIEEVIKKAARPLLNLALDKTHQVRTTLAHAERDKYLKSRELALAITKLDEAEMWMEKIPWR